MSTNAHAGQRLAFVDAHRGLAVVLMLWMHSADGWLQPALKQGFAWNAVRSLGGLAAPTFLLLAGLSVGLGWSRNAGLTGRTQASAMRGELARGLQIVLLGYALRLQMWMLDGAGYRLAEGWACAVPLAAGYTCAYLALGAMTRGGERQALRLGAVAGASTLLGLTLVSQLLPDRIGSLLRVDVLQAIGASLAILACVRGPIRRLPVLGLAIGLAIALLTPWARTFVPGPLPAAVAGYLAQWDVGPGRPAATLFPLFPWMSYAFIGATLGLWIGAAEARGALGRALLGLSITGGGLAFLACEPLPTGHFLVSAFPDLTQAVRVVYRCGVAMVLGGLCFVLCTWRTPLSAGLLLLGRASLFVYWVHLQFAFGAAAKIVAHRLDFTQWAVGFVLLTLVMSLLAVGWVRFRTSQAVRARDGKTLQNPGSEPASMTHA